MAKNAHSVSDQHLFTPCISVNYGLEKLFRNKSSLKARISNGVSEIKTPWGLIELPNFSTFVLVLVNAASTDGQRCGERHDLKSDLSCLIEVDDVAASYVVSDIAELLEITVEDVP